ncbi:hypothetical protein ACHHYP_11823 [Achlya hypogyna]|uniref:Tc1-like transposase DDE domain-containing protein n=1 Tax=Achlya hypogyna TaxID=1202772 RepID=A0A1V9ZHD5_ACHHY|nr:hypothetical protein ACHHYP_11823 [Achlya hypogyna]
MGKMGVIIALDNASYHKGARLVEACELIGIAASISDYKTKIWDQVKHHVKEHIWPPIELLWDFVKGGFGRQYTV